MTSLILALVLVLTFSSSGAPVIDAASADRLQPVQQIDFAALDAEFLYGWFIMNASGTRIFVVDSDRTGYLLDDSGDMLWEIALRQTPSNLGFIVDGAFTADDRALVLLVDEALLIFDLETGAYAWFAQDAAARGLALWISEGELWIEALRQSDGSTVVQRYAGLAEGELRLLETLDYPPYQDPQAVVRIGRIPAPYVVTSSLEGRVTLWDMQAGRALFDVNNQAGEPSVFGNINASATHLVWRDNANQVLYLLGFANGENLRLDQLAGDYVQWFFLTPAADLALGVQIGAEQHVYAWDAEVPGVRMDLGPFRECGRAQPDMARLSADGTTLVIGCPLGLEIWRVQPE